MAFDNETGKKAGKLSKRGADTQLKELRDFYSNLLENNQDNIQNWFDAVAKKDPAKALELILKLSSFIIPKPRTIELKNSIEVDFNPIVINLGTGINPNKENGTDNN